MLVVLPIIGEGSPTDPRALQLATKDGTYIPNFRMSELPPEVQKSAEQMFRVGHATAQLRSSTSLYNCVGQVFAARRTWVEINHLRTILEGDGYRRVQEVRDLWIGDIVVYSDAHNEVTHVGVVVEKRPDLVAGRHQIYLLSKWGQNGEYLHEMDDVPTLLGRPTSFWTERRVD